MAASLEVHDRIMRKAIESHHGHVFSTADDAAHAVLDSQLGVLDAEWPGYIEIDDPATGPGADWTSGTPVIVQPDPDEPWKGLVVFELGEFEAPPQAEVTATASENGEPVVVVTTQVIDFTIDTVDEANDTVSGTAPIGEDVLVRADHAWRYPTVDEDGNWQADFSSPGDLTGEEQSVDIQPGSEGEATLLDSDGNASSIAWRVSNAQFQVDPDNESVWGNGWASNGSVAITVDSQAVPGSPFDTDDDGNFNGWWDVSALDLVAGDTVVATDSDTTKQHQITNLVVTDIDPDENTVTGTAGADAEVWVDIHGAHNVGRTVIANGVGVWVADFDDPGDDGGTTADIESGVEGYASECDDDSDCTQVNWRLPRATFTVMGANIGGNEWLPNTQLTVSIARNGSVLTPPDGPYFTDPEGHFWIGWEPGLLITEGDFVTVSDGVNTKTHHVTGLAITGVDPDTDTVFGTAAADSTVDVWAHDVHAWRTVTADSGGAWSADLSATGIDEPHEQGDGTADLVPGSNGNSGQCDEDGDCTNAEWWVPLAQFNVDPHGNWMWGNDWLPDSNVTVAIGGQSWTIPTDERGEFAHGWDPFELDLIAGMEIAVTDGESTKTHKVTDLAIVGVDAESNVVTGTGTPGMLLAIWIHQSGAYLELTVDGSGLWMADFTDLGGIEPTYDGNSAQCEEDQDCTFAGWHVPPTVTVSKTADHSEVFAPGETVTFTVEVTNAGQNLGVHVDSLSDNLWGDLSGLDGCELPQWIGPGETMGCSYEWLVTESLANTVTAQWTDDWGFSASGSAEQSVTLLGPAVSIDKTTADAFGTEGDGVGILIGESVTWSLPVTNEGDVTFTELVVTDDALGELCRIFDLGPGATALCSATGIAEAGYHANLATVVGTVVDADGDEMMVEASDESAYYGLEPGYVTAGELCAIDTFDLIFTPDMKNWPGRYKLSASNPGQTFLHAFAVGEVDGVTLLELPYPFVTQGAMPVTVHDGVFAADGPCLTPADEGTSMDLVVSLDDYEDSNGDGVVAIGDVYHLEVPSDGGLDYMVVHLDFGLKSTKGWIGIDGDAANDPLLNPDLEGVRVDDGTGFVFGVNDVVATAITNANTFKNVKGFGGLVTEVATGDPVLGAIVELQRMNGSHLETMASDEHGWYLSEYWHKGKTAKYRLVLVDSDGEPLQTQVVTVGKSAKFGEANFAI